MSRRPLSLLVIVAATMILAACSQTTAPTRSDTGTSCDSNCRGWTGSAG